MSLRRPELRDWRAARLDQMALAERSVHDLDQAKAEVVVAIIVLTPIAPHEPTWPWVWCTEARRG